MVKLIINQEEYPSTRSLLEIAFEHGKKDDVIYVMKTQEYPCCRNPKTHEYLIESDYTVKMDENNLFIISDHICSVIDLTKELPYEIRTKGIGEC